MLFNRSGSRTPPNPTPTNPADEPTAVYSGWPNILHRHTLAQQPTPSVTTTVGPRSTSATDGIRHGPTPFSHGPTGQNPNTHPTQQNTHPTQQNPARRPAADETAIFPRVDRPGYHPTQMYPTVTPTIHPRSHPTNPTGPTTLQNQHQDPTDIGAQLHRAEQQVPYQQRRVLEYYGNPQFKNIITVIGAQVHRATAQGVIITENGPNIQRSLIPWHRVHDLRFAPGDPILNNL